jgi:serine/threonine-protein kinase RIO1
VLSSNAKTLKFCLQEATLQTSRSAGCLTVVREKKKASKVYPQFQSVNESNALKNWQANMAERRRQQNYLSREMFAVFFWNSLLLIVKNWPLRAIQQLLIIS